MTVTRFIKNTTSIVMLLIWNSISAQNCVDYTDLPNEAWYYNSFTEYPSGSVLHQFGDVKMANLNDVLHPTNPTLLDSIDGTLIYFKGRLVYDVSSFEPSCKKVLFNTTADTLYINFHKVPLPFVQSVPFKIGDDIQVDFTDGFINVLGSFDSISFQAIGQATIEDFCLSECSGEENCTVDFKYNLKESGQVEFTNLSSLNSDNADVFTWDFGDGNTAFDNDPSFTFSEEKKYKVCLFIDYSSCIFGGPSLSKCDSVDVIFNFVDEDAHATLTPNGDGIGDYVSLQGGSKIYNRFGQIVQEVSIETKWEGFDRNGLLLPMGSYTVVNNAGKTFSITIVR